MFNSARIVRSPLISKRFSRPPGPARKTRVNHEIRITPIRLINENNEQVGVVETDEARRMAMDAGLDLVEIQPDVRPPICKIMDYGKFKYEQSKKQQKSRAATKQAEMKEVRLGRSAKIDPHDVDIRVNQARRFLMDGHKVQFVQRFRGREMAHRDIGFKRLEEICEQLSDIAKLEVPPRAMGRQISIILAPDKPKISAIKAKQAKESGKVSEPSADADVDDGHDVEPAHDESQTETSSA